MRLSLFASAYDEEPKLWEGTWAEFAEQLSSHNYTRTVKEECPAFSPAIYPEGTESREKSRVIELSAFVMDVDGLTQEQAVRLCGDVKDLGLCAAVYTTWSHAAVAPARYKLRIVIPLSRPVLAAAWLGFWVRANALFGGVCDPKTKNADRIFFAPYAPAGSEELNFCLQFAGEPLDVDLVMELDPGEAAAEAPPDQSILSREELERFAKTLARKKSDERKSELGEVLLKVVAGEAFAEPGQRDNVLFRLAQVLATRFPDRTPESVASHFQQSCARMARIADGAPSVEVVAYKIRRAQEGIRAEQAREQAKEQDEQRARIREAFKNGRSEPYSLDELNSFGPSIAKRWIIQRGRSFYFFVGNIRGGGGSYVGPFTTDDMQAAADRELAPAISAGVSLYKLNKDGSVSFKTIPQLVRQYGTVAQKTVLDLRARVATYDDDSRTIIEAPCPMREIQAVEHKEIDAWLKLLAGERYEDLKSWLAAVTYLDEPCVALFLTGPRGTGKSLLALGVSRIWTTGRPTPLEEVFADFNEALASCPLCFADEQLPKDVRGFAKNAELRHHIQAIQRPLKRKFQPNATLIGATRTIVAANNEDVLSTQENLSAYDIEAIIDRYFHVPTQKEAADYLRDADTSEWVRGDRIAEHVLFLVENHQWRSQGRFLIKVQDDSLHRQLVTRTGVRSAICQWLTGYLLNPRKFDNDAKAMDLVRIDNQRLLVNAQGILNCWDSYVRNERCPTTGHLSSDLIALCRDVPRVRLMNRSGARVNYRVFNTDNLFAWAERNGFADREQLGEALARDTVIRTAVDPSKRDVN
jgi:hypothetical protein